MDPSRFAAVFGVLAALFALGALACLVTMARTTSPVTSAQAAYVCCLSSAVGLLLGAIAIGITLSPTEPDLALQLMAGCALAAAASLALMVPAGRRRHQVEQLHGQR